MENLKRENGKIEEYKKQSEAKNRRISELEEAVTAIQRCIIYYYLLISWINSFFSLLFTAFAEEEQAYEKKLEGLRAKLALESKLKEDVQTMKTRLETDLEEAEKISGEDTQKRKRFEAENWSLRAEIEELRRKLIDEAEGYTRKLESEGHLRSVLQDANDRLQVMSIL